MRDAKAKLEVQKDNLAVAEARQEAKQKDLDAKKVEADNMFVRAYNYLMKKAGQTAVAYDVQVLVNVPFSRGLGSSSTAILAGLTLANETLRREHQMAYRIEQLLDFAQFASHHEVEDEKDVDESNIDELI
jgi:homoserine kinase